MCRPRMGNTPPAELGERIARQIVAGRVNELSPASGLAEEQRMSQLPSKSCLKAYYLNRAGRSIAYGMGCAWLGRSDDQAGIQADIQTLEAAYDAGFRYFDTSAAYGDSELRLGQFIPRVARDSLFIATKSGIPPQLSPGEAAVFVQQSLARSLERLHTDHIDLFQIHDVGTLEQVLAEHGVLEVLLEARRQGVIRYYGLATRHHVLLEVATRRGDFDTILTYSDYTPLDQSAGPLIALASARGVGVINASPLSSGLLTGRDPREIGAPAHTDQDRRRQRAIQFYDLCQQFNTPVLAAALQFPLSNPNVDITLTGPASVAEVTAGVRALETPVPPGLWPARQEPVQSRREAE